MRNLTVKYNINFAYFLIFYTLFKLCKNNGFIFYILINSNTYYKCVKENQKLLFFFFISVFLNYFYVLKVEHIHIKI